MDEEDLEDFDEEENNLSNETAIEEKKKEPEMPTQKENSTKPSESGSSTHKVPLKKTKPRKKKITVDGVDITTFKLKSAEK